MNELNFGKMGHTKPCWFQGYPDGYTDIGDWTDSKGKKHKYADSPRYKALGNSIALPQWF